MNLISGEKNGFDATSSNKDRSAKYRFGNLFNNEKSNFAMVLSLLISISSLVVILFLIVKLYPLTPLETPNIFYIPSVAIQPEPIERMQFLVGILLFPVLFGLSYVAINRPLVSIRDSATVAKLLYFSGLVAVFAFTWFVSYEDDYFFLTNNYFYQSPWVSVPLFGLALLLVLFYSLCLKENKKFPKPLTPNPLNTPPQSLTLPKYQKVYGFTIFY